QFLCTYAQSVNTFVFVQSYIVTMSFLNSKSGDDMEEKILLPYTHIKKLPTKEWRRNMKTSFNYWLRVPQDKMEEVVDITEMFYVCTVIEDDILDGTKLRRGVPTAHSTFGLPLTVNSIAHLLLLAALIFSEEGLELFRGQGAEVYTRDNFICPTEEDYMTTQAKKLRGIFNLCFRLMQLFSDDKTDYSDFVVKLSMYFQMRGDYCNICNSKALQECSPSTNQNSGDFYDDLTEGKFTLPIIHATKTSKRDAILTGSLQYTRDLLTKLDSELRDEIKKFGEWCRNMQTSFNHWLRVPQDKLEEVINITEMFYICTVIEDDILDGTKLRRGVPTAHSTFGLPLTAAMIFSEEALELFRGQGAEVYTRDNFICPTEEEYMTMQEKKLRGIYYFCFRLMQLFSDQKTDYSDFVVKLSMYFQVRDDYCNICKPKALQECSPATNEQKTNDFTLKQYCVSLLEQAGSLQYTRDVLTKLDSELRDEIKKFGDSYTGSKL
ncbi:unnamed protein product, partial [Leptidea sinapis]